MSKWYPWLAVQSKITAKCVQCGRTYPSFITIFNPDGDRSRKPQETRINCIGSASTSFFMKSNASHILDLEYRLQGPIRSVFRSWWPSADSASELQRPEHPLFVSVFQESRVKSYLVISYTAGTSLSSTPAFDYEKAVSGLPQTHFIVFRCDNSYLRRPARSKLTRRASSKNM